MPKNSIKNVLTLPILHFKIITVHTLFYDKSSLSNKHTLHGKIKLSVLLHYNFGLSYKSHRSDSRLTSVQVSKCLAQCNYFKGSWQKEICYINFKTVLSLCTYIIYVHTTFT